MYKYNIKVFKSFTYVLDYDWMSFSYMAGFEIALPFKRRS